MKELLLWRTVMDVHIQGHTETALLIQTAERTRATGHHRRVHRDLDSEEEVGTQLRRIAEHQIGR